MARIHNTILINRSPEEVFDYVTTAAYWPNWHPSSVGVQGAIDHSALPGEQMIEDFRVTGREDQAVWTVRERHSPRRWVIDGRARTGGNATITYTLTPQTGATLFERELVYRLPGILGVILDPLLIRPRVRTESQEALQRLKKVLEERPKAGF